MKQSIACFVILCIAIVLPAIAEESKRVAVLDFRNPADLPQQEVNYIVELVRESARKALPPQRYILLTKENILEMLPEGSRLVDCSDAECAVQVGRMVGADYVVDGDVTRFGGELRVRFSLHDTVNGNVLSIQRAGGKSVISLEDTVSEASGKLFLILPNARIFSSVASIVETRKTRTQKPPPRKVSTSPVKVSDNPQYQQLSCGAVRDMQTGLDWYIGPDQDTNWNEAAQWTASLTTCGGGWQMPSVSELHKLYSKSSKVQELVQRITENGWYVWAIPRKEDGTAWFFDFRKGTSRRFEIDYRTNRRAFAVRSFR